MKVTWVLLLALGVVAADVSHLGYHYKVPQTSYGVPSYQTAGTSGQYSTAFAGSQGQQNTGFQTASSGAGYYQTAGSHNLHNLHNLQHTSGSNNLQTGFQTQYDASSQYQGLNKYQNYYQVQHQPAQVFKHFYVHAAPEEHEEVKPRAPIVLPPPQKHYKIIFVKAPTESRQPQVIAPIQPQNEEKTIVYVLVKKPDEQAEVVLPKIEQKPPSKPEVYFIKYKNKDDSQAVINNIVQDYSSGGQSVSVNSGAAGGSSSFSSGLSSAQYQPTVQQGESTASFGQGSTGSFGQGSTGSFGQGSTGSFGQGSTGSFGQSFGLSSASANSGGSLDSSNFASTFGSPVTISSTASSVGFDSSAISTSQGVPHENYGPPKFRVNN